MENVIVWLGENETVKVGNYIRSLDFPGNTEHFLEGIVTAVNEFIIEFQIIRQVVEGSEYPSSANCTTARTAVPGGHFLDSKMVRIGVFQ
jgi:hypothetical protein